MTRSVERTFDILEVLAASEDVLSLSELHERVSISPATAHRLLRTLINLGYATQDENTRRYGPGPRLLEVAAKATDNGRFDLRRIALPCLRQMTSETGETSNLALLSGDDVVYIEQVRSPRIVRIFTEVGHRAPLYCTAAGKAILSRFSADDLETYLAGVALERLTPQTITSAERLLDEIKEVRRRGFAIDNEEREEGVRCVAAPVLDHVGVCRAAISISGPAARIDLDRAAEELGPVAGRWAARCGAQLGYGAPVGDGRSARAIVKGKGKDAKAE